MGKKINMCEFFAEKGVMNANGSFLSLPEYSSCY